MRDLLAFRLAQANEALEEARTLNEARHPRGAINRSYYAMFYAIQALLTSRGLTTSKHSGAIELFDREFVRQNQFGKDFSRWLHQLFELRQDADYGPMVEATAEQARNAIEQAEAFIQQTKGYLSQVS